MEFTETIEEYRKTKKNAVSLSVLNSSFSFAVYPQSLYDFLNSCTSFSRKNYLLFFSTSLQMETRKLITDLIQERFKELKVETQLLHNKWR